MTLEEQITRFEQGVRYLKRTRMWLVDSALAHFTVVLWFVCYLFAAADSIVKALCTIGAICFVGHRWWTATVGYWETRKLIQVSEVHLAQLRAKR